MAKCPTWSWEGGDKKRDFLPDGKQFLVTRRVPCLQCIRGRLWAVRGGHHLLRRVRVC